MAITNSTKDITTKLTNQQLSIQISLNGLSFCVLNQDTNTLTYLREFDFEKKLNPIELLDQLINLFHSEDPLKVNFNKVSVVYNNELSTLVPKSLFQEESLADYLKFNSKILKSDYITYDEIQLGNCICVYVPFVNINNFLYEKFGEFTFKHISSVLIESVLQSEKNSEKTKLFVHVNAKNFELVIIEKSKLLFCNSFEYSTKEDFIYYILFTAEQLNLNPETFNLVFLGDINEEDTLYEITYKYVRHISFGSRNDIYTIKDNIDSKHSNYALIKNI